MTIAEINRRRDEIIANQKPAWPGGLVLPILGLCCYYAHSEKVHSYCECGGCVCPCHATRLESESCVQAGEEALEALWKEQKGVNPETGEMWLTPRMEREAKQLAKRLESESCSTIAPDPVPGRT